MIRVVPLTPPRVLLVAPWVVRGSRECGGVVLSEVMIRVPTLSQIPKKLLPVVKKKPRLVIQRFVAFAVVAALS